MITFIHVGLCFVGLVLSLVRLRIVARPFPSMRCRFRWWVWVLAKTLFACGFFAGMISPLYGSDEPTTAAWFIRVGLVIFLLLRIRIEPEFDK